MAPTPPIITLKELARRAGLATSTVSYALRNSPQVSRETCHLVQNLANHLGYRPNPRVASLMAHIRQAQSRSPTDSIAFIWVDCSRQECSKAAFLQLLISGTKQRAEQAGYKIQQFWLNDPGMSPKRIRDILVAQGIVGLVFSAATTHTTMDLHFDMAPFSTAVIGSATWIPELHRASHNHYDGMRLCLKELTARGVRKPVALLKKALNDRCHYSYEAAFLTHAPQGHAARCIRMVNSIQGRDLSTWIQQLGADGLIVSSSDFVGLGNLRKIQKKYSIPIATLYWNPADIGLCGIDQCYDQVASKAVDLVVTQLNNNEHGIPEISHTLHFPGKWMWPE